MKKSIITYILLVFSFLLFVGDATGQNGEKDILDQKITLSAENITISELLTEIGEKASIQFSYNPNLINANRRVSLESSAQPVRDVLDQIFTGEIGYKIRGNYVIIVAQERMKEEIEHKDALLSGLILDHETQVGIPEVSVFTSSGELALSDQAGAFAIKLKKGDRSIVQFRKKGFRDFEYESTGGPQSDINIKMSPIKRLAIHVERPAVEAKPIASTQPNVHLNTIFPIKRTLKVHQENITDSLTRPFSFSLYPGLSTHGNLSGSIEYNFALNFVGYNRGINGLEFGVLSNISKENVRGATFAGLSSYVGGNVKGVQSSGIFNVVGRDVKGIQMAGISNATIGDVVGAQFAGISNHAQSNFKGLQASGIYNQTDTIVGSQLAGIMNYAKKSDGFQASGIMNLTHESDGLQLAGIANVSPKMKGAQIAGIANVSSKVDGTQIAGIINIGGNVHGSQIGLLNVADSISGVPIGLLSFVKKDGYRRVGAYYDELFPMNMEFKTGVKRFYNILLAGTQTDINDNDDAFYTFGYGVGTSASITNGFSLDFDLTGQYITKREFTDTESMLFKSYLGLELNIAGSVSIVGGATFNAYYFDHDLLADEDFNNLRTDYLFDDVVNNGSHVWRGWLGYRGGIRFTL